MLINKDTAASTARAALLIINIVHPGRRPEVAPAAAAHTLYILIIRNCSDMYSRRIIDLAHSFLLKYSVRISHKGREHPQIETAINY